jgi:hypothetical protein
VGVHGVLTVAMSGSLILPPRLKLLTTPKIGTKFYKDAFLASLATFLGSLLLPLISTAIKWIFLLMSLVLIPMRVVFQLFQLFLRNWNNERHSQNRQNESWNWFEWSKQAINLSA